MGAIGQDSRWLRLSTGAAERRLLRREVVDPAGHWQRLYLTATHPVGSAPATLLAERAAQRAWSGWLTVHLAHYHHYGDADGGADRDQQH